MNPITRIELPNRLTYWRVDEAIECLSFGPNRQLVESELLALMPDAYGGEAPGEDAWPEPDAKRDAPYRLSNIWDKIAPNVQRIIAEAAAAL